MTEVTFLIEVKVTILRVKATILRAVQIIKQTRILNSTVIATRFAITLDILHLIAIVGWTTHTKVSILLSSLLP